MNYDEIADFLGEVSLFTNLDLNQRREIMINGQIKSCYTGETLSFNSSDNALYILLSGEVVGLKTVDKKPVWERGDREEIRRDVVRKLAAAEGGRYVFMSDHSVSSSVSGQTYDDIVKLVRELGVYPLPEEVIGKSTNVLRSGHHDRDFYAGLWRTIESGQVWRGEIVNRKKDGTYVRTHFRSKAN